ncbi:MAG: hypothetical protein D3926_07430 [Desulfobacteraceae bacterium]|nr:MAG: hypothetical protein D3926_07430 [Desulfobacteraceae bacterium]
MVRYKIRNILKLFKREGNYGFCNIPGDVNSLEEGTAQFSNGKTDFGEVGYNGPMLPNGHGFHYYYFWVLALKEAVDLEQGLSLWDFLSEIEPQLIGMSRLVGRYKRD